MNRETYIAPIVESYIPDATQAEKLALTREFWTLFDALYSVFQEGKRFDSLPAEMVESDSLELTKPAPKP